VFSASLVLSLAAAAAPVPVQSSPGLATPGVTGQLVALREYASAQAVYLDTSAALASPGATAPLADGDYYFQVTDASGSLLLSRDAIDERCVRIAGGAVVAYLGTTHAVRRGAVPGTRRVGLAPFDPTPHPSDEYKVWVTRVEHCDPAGSGFFGFAAPFSRAETFTVDDTGTLGLKSFIHGIKFFDHDENGVFDPKLDPLEVPIAGWRVEILREGVIDGVTFTDQTGRYEFVRERDGTEYLIREIAPGGFIGDNVPGAVWLATTVRERAIVADREQMRGPFFGNVSFEVKPGVGRTKGFWSNQNGAYMLAACDPTWRDVLTTRNGAPIQLRWPISSDDPNVSVFAPLQLPATFTAAFLDWKTYEVGDGAQGHAGYILSTQVAAAMLSRSCGFMQFDAYIDRFQNGILVPFETMLDGAIGLLTSPGAGLTGPHDPYQALRAQMLGCVNEFGSINNTSDPSSPQVVWGSTDSPGFFNSPY
jgi:hypothetical protein